MAAAVSLMKAVGAEVTECVVVIELTGLKGRDKVSAPTFSLIQYDDL